jgi:general secretion pathway protein C
MLAISLDRSSLAQTAVVPLVTFAALALLGLVLAYWSWALLAPRPEPRAQAVAQTGGRAQAAHGLFGSAQPGRSGPAPTGIAIRLLGVVAATGGRPGYAVMKLDAGKTLAVREGADVAPGVRLAEVDADHVVLERSGVRETLAWPNRKTPKTKSATRAEH